MELARGREGSPRRICNAYVTKLRRDRDVTDWRDSRILYASSVDVSIGNGPGVNEREFVEVLARQFGSRAEFVLPDPRSHMSFMDGLQVHLVPGHAEHSVWPYFKHTLSLASKLDELLASGRFDFAVFRVDVLPWAYVWAIRRNPRVPFAVKTLGRGVVNALWGRWGPLGRVLERVNRRMVAQMVDASLVTDVCSGPQRDYLAQVLDVDRDVLTWVDNAVNTRRFVPESPKVVRKRLGLPLEGPVIGYVGTRPSERGARQLIDVVHGLAKDYPDIHVLVVGGGPQVDDLKIHAAKLGVGARCTFAGYIPFDQVPDHVNALDVGVSLNVKDSRAAAAELKVRQYVSCGRPVVASPGGNEFLERERLGTIVEANHLDAIATALRSWLGMTALQKASFADRAHTFAREHLSMEAALKERLTIWSQGELGRKP